MTAWTVIRDRDVLQYLYASTPELRAAVWSLSKGVPPDARKVQDVPETWEWAEARHWITFIVNRKGLLIYVSDVSEIRI